MAIFSTKSIFIHNTLPAKSFSFILYTFNSYLNIFDIAIQVAFLRIVAHFRLSIFLFHIQTEFLLCSVFTFEIVYKLTGFCSYTRLYRVYFPEVHFSCTYIFYLFLFVSLSCNAGICFMLYTFYKT